MRIDNPVGLGFGIFWGFFLGGLVLSALTAVFWACFAGFFIGGFTFPLLFG